MASRRCVASPRPVWVDEVDSVDARGEMHGTSWWGEVRMASGQHVRWAIGPLDLWIDRREREWRIAAREDPDPLREGAWCSGPSSDGGVPEDVVPRRFASSSDGLLLQPRLADRPMVLRPETDLFIPQGEQAVLYVSTPVWLEVVTLEGASLIELPVTRPSDTWFGPSAREGELCYAGRTSARLRLDELRAHDGRVFTEVRVRNHGRDVFRVERLHLPAPNLSVHASDSGTLWSPTVTFTRGKDEPVADVAVASGPSSVAGAVERLTAPRRGGLPTIMVRAFSALLT